MIVLLVCTITLIEKRASQPSRVCQPTHDFLLLPIHLGEVLLNSHGLLDNLLQEVCVQLFSLTGFRHVLMLLIALVDLVLQLQKQVLECHELVLYCALQLRLLFLQIFDACGGLFEGHLRLLPIFKLPLRWLLVVLVIFGGEQALRRHLFLVENVPHGGEHVVLAALADPQALLRPGPRVVGHVPDILALLLEVVEAEAAVIVAREVGGLMLVEGLEADLLARSV